MNNRKQSNMLSLTSLKRGDASIFAPFSITLAILATGLTSGLSTAEEVEREVASNETGKAAYELHCASCHGASANGNDQLGAPALAGQLAGYTLRQLTLFKTELRGTEDSYASVMKAVANTLGSEEIESAVANYVAKLANDNQYAIDGDADNGYKYYQSSCGGCHGAKAEGNVNFNAPRLSGIDPQYLLRQYEHFQKDKRGGDGGDRLSRQMSMMAKVLPDTKTLTDVLSFIATTNSAQEPKGASK